MKKNTKVTTFINRETTIILIVIALLFGLLLGIDFTLAVNKAANNNNNSNSNYVVCDVIAATDDTYVLKCVNDGSMFEIDTSEMYGIGETVLVQYNNNQIVNVWLYVDC